MDKLESTAKLTVESKEPDIEMSDKILDDEMEEGEASSDDDDVEVRVTISESPLKNKASIPHNLPLPSDRLILRPLGRCTPPYVSCWECKQR